MIQIEGMNKGRGRLKITLAEVIENDMSIKGVTKNMALDRVEWRKRIDMANPN